MINLKGYTIIPNIEIIPINTYAIIIPNIGSSGPNPIYAYALVYVAKL